MASLFVINARGKKEPFSFKKVYRSAKRAGAFGKTARRIAETIKREVYPGIRTSEIFRRIKRILREEVPEAALKFNIKEGMRKLGPTGFPFEKYAGEILRNLGYKVKINQFLPAKCVRRYEIDFVAEKGKTVYIGECKYRQDLGDIVRSPDALINYARFLDIFEGNRFKSSKYKNHKIVSLIAIAWGQSFWDGIIPKIGDWNIL
jgi:Holliday junction resolvase